MKSSRYPGVDIQLTDGSSEETKSLLIEVKYFNKLIFKSDFRKPKDCIEVLIYCNSEGSEVEGYSLGYPTDTLNEIARRLQVAGVKDIKSSDLEIEIDSVFNSESMYNNYL